MRDAPKRPKLAFSDSVRTLASSTVKRMRFEASSARTFVPSPAATSAAFRSVIKSAATALSPCASLVSATCVASPLNSNTNSTGLSNAAAGSSAAATGFTNCPFAGATTLEVKARPAPMPRPPLSEVRIVPPLMAVTLNSSLMALPVLLIASRKLPANCTPGTFSDTVALN